MLCYKKKKNIDNDKLQKGEVAVGGVRVGSFHLVKSSLSVALVGVTTISGLFLASSFVSADNNTVVDDVSILVPTACTLSGTGTGTHTDTINPGQYQADIGTTTLKALCNDSAGFAIYATGYTGNTIGETNSNKLIGQNTNELIPTGIGTSGDSQWAMKLATDSTATYPITIGSAPNTSGGADASFSSYHTVPNEYTKVAYRLEGTDVGNDATGSTLTTTYAANIASTQAADTYSGRVIYTLVHPNNAPAPVQPDQIGVSFDGNGNTFSGGGTKNRLVYQNTCTTMYKGTTPTISKTPNVNNDGTASSGYAYNFTQNDPVTIQGADQLYIELDYGIENNYDYLYVFEGTYSGEITGGEGAPMEAGQIATYTGGNGSDDTQFTAGESTTFYVDGDTVTFAFFGDDYEDTGYYGYYAKVYPLYEIEQSGTTAIETCGLSPTPVTGTYATTTTWYGSWYADIGGTHYDFTDESEITSFLENNTSTLLGTTIDLYRSLSINEAYANANKSQTGGYYVAQDLNNNICQTIAIAQTGTIIDNRDNNTYMIGRLKDGNCWMLDNLRLDPTDSTTASNMNANNTNATTEAITNYLNGGSSNTGWSNVAVANVTSGFNSYIAPMINNASKDTLVTSYGPASTSGQAKVGIYYNYCAATVGTYCYADGSGVDVADTIIDAPYDLCPANWRMPTGGSNGEYQALYDKYNTTMDATNSASLQYNLSTSLSGFYYNSSAYDQGLWGDWWSSTYNNGSGNMYKLGVNSKTVSPNNISDRCEGNSMRCLVGD